MAVVSMNEQMPGDPPDGEDDGEDVPEYRVSHLMDELADAFTDRIQLVAPMEKGGLKPRVNNRVTFTVTNTKSDHRNREYVEDTLDSAGFAWTHAPVDEKGTPYIVLGRTVTDLRELRAGDRIHLNKRGGPFRAYRVLEQPSGPEVLQRSEESVTVEVTNADTGTDWMVVQWAGKQDPWAYVRTKDKDASGGFRWRKVEDVERMARVGPRRLFAPPPDLKEDVERHVPEQVEWARDNHLGENRVIHPMDLDRVERLFTKPVADLYTAEDADVVREFLREMSEWHERQAGGLTMETDEDKAHAADRQESARLCERLSDAFNLLEMDVVALDGEADVYEHGPCGVAYTDRFKYSKHCGLCEADSDDEQADEREDTES